MMSGHGDVPPSNGPHARPPREEPWTAPPQVSRHLPRRRPQVPTLPIIESCLSVSMGRLRLVPSISIREEGSTPCLADAIDHGGALLLSCLSAGLPSWIAS